MPSEAAAREASRPLPYVPRLALERALAELSELIGKTPACAVLTGEAGLGKTRLLRVLHERLAGAFECFYLPSRDLAAGPFWSGVASAIGLGSGDDDRGAVLGRAQSLHGDGSGLVLLIDDAGRLSPDLVADLLAASAAPGLSIVLALRGDELGDGVAPDLLRRVDLGPPLTLAEARAYAQAELRHRDPSGALAARLTSRALAEMHEAAGGNPGRLDALLEAWQIRGGGAASEAPAGVDPLDRLRAAARERQPTPVRPVPAALGGLRRRLAQPNVRLGLSALFVLLIGGFWYFALQRAGGGASIGVPVERFRAPSEAPAPALAPVVEPAPVAPEPPATPPVTEPASAAPAAPAAAAAPVAETPRESFRRLLGSLRDLAGFAESARAGVSG